MRYEYGRLLMRASGAAEVNELLAQVNELARDGWEVLQVYPVDAQHEVWIMRREIVPGPSERKAKKKRLRPFPVSY